jgi:hypothetical protein
MILFGQPRYSDAAAGVARAALRLLLFLFVCSAHAGASPQPEEQGRRAAFAPQFAIGDFDGDHRPDLANVRTGAGSRGGVLYWIDFRLSTGFWRTFGVTASAGGLKLVSRDVNGDHLLDVVVTTFLTDEPVVVLLNDGRGNFTPREPSAFPEAFQRPVDSFSSETGIADRTGAVSPRVPTKGAAMASWFGSPPNPAAPSTASLFPLVTGSGRNVRVGRAPPTVAGLANR